MVIRKFINTASSLCLFIFSYHSLAQNQNNKWYFGFNAGLDFMTNPPTALTNGAMSTSEGCATISDSAGNLLFYTNGVTVFNKLHAVMQNGTGLGGNISSSQSAIIEKKPGSNSLYYIFTQSGSNNPAIGTAYSIVDLSMAAGMGSVTVKIATLATPTSEKLTSTKHCNGSDTWVIVHGDNSAVFMSFLLTSSGVNTVPVLSTLGSVQDLLDIGCMKISPNGRKLGLALNYLDKFEVFDFDENFIDNCVQYVICFAHKLSQHYL
jgi:hypothetical protein